MQGPQWPFLLRFMSRDTRRIDFPQVDELSTDTPGLGHHSLVSELRYTITCSVMGMGLGYAVVV